MLNVLLLSWNLAYADSSPYSFTCTKENLSGTDKAHLRVYRNEVFARYGRTFKSTDLNQIFNQSSWYVIDKAYTDERLTDSDTSCVKLIQSLEKNAGNVVKPDLDGDGVGESISYDGKVLKVNGVSVVVNEDLSYFQDSDYRTASDFRYLLSVEDFKYLDGKRELFVITNPGIEDEIEFQIYRYMNKTLTPLLKKEWVPYNSFKRSQGKMTHTSDNCNTTTTSEFVYTNQGIIRKDTVKGTFDSKYCAACPFVYLTDEKMEFVDEILRNQHSEELYGPDEILLGNRREGDVVNVKIVEVKPEISYIDHLSLVVENPQGEIWMETPVTCKDGSKQIDYCSEDGASFILPYGSELDVGFVVPQSGKVSLRAVGYYIPFSE